MSFMNPYVTFNGNCEAAFKFYQSVFGGELTLCRFKDAPADAFTCKDNEKEKVMHVSLCIGNTLLMGSDTSESCGQAVHVGDNITINICPDDEADAKRIFNALADGGKIIMPIEKTFWADLFGMCVDKFGIPWMVNFAHEKKCCDSSKTKTACH